MEEEKNNQLEFITKEKEILDFWEKNKIFEKSLATRKKAPKFTFYEGPPTANNKPGVHHILARIYKDLFCRYKTQRGYLVKRKAGWDTHGLPVELAIEKELGFTNKFEIEKYGVDKFNQKARESVFRYIEDWNNTTSRIGYWLDLDNAYLTCATSYIESLWWILKQIDQKNLLFKGYKVVPYCPRCGTALSSHEVAQGYKTVRDPSVFIKFKILGNNNLFDQEVSLLVWTTTPWTLFANVAIAVHPNLEYFVFKVDNEYLISHFDLTQLDFLKDKEVIKVKQFWGKDLIGLPYEPLFKHEKYVQENQNIYHVIAGDFVSADEGTGLVHIAPAFGVDDMNVGILENLPIILDVNERGELIDDLNVLEEVKGLFFKKADPLVIENLKKRGLLLYYDLEGTEHEYPFCWRCETPLIYKALESWFIKMSALKQELIKNNDQINWVPSHIKEGRFGEWLEDIRDWSLSRDRYWGTPLPVWFCEKCGQKKVIGSLKELENQSFYKTQFYYLRHGDCLSVKKKIVSCSPEKFDNHLTKIGRIEVEEAAREMKKKNIKIDIIISSTLLRAKESAEIVQKYFDCPLIYDDRLDETNFGAYNSKSATFIRKWANKIKEGKEVTFPQGENYVDRQKQVFDLLLDLNQKYCGKNILLVSHKGVIKLAEAKLKNIDLYKYLFDESWPKTGEWGKLSWKNLPYNTFTHEVDLHKPYIDNFVLRCDKCQGKMIRVKEVIDCWFDSGSMPYAQDHFPFDFTKEMDLKTLNYYRQRGFEFPADFISEGIDHTRGWFYVLLAVSTALGFGPSFKNVVVLGLILDEKGEKMSKSKGNVVDPKIILDKYGADSLRWYLYTTNAPSEFKKFSESDLVASQRRFLNIFWNVYKFYDTYALKTEKWSQSTVLKNYKKLGLLDKWILSRLMNTKREFLRAMDNYDSYKASQLLDSFVNDLSRWYLRRSRKRLQNKENQKDIKIISGVLGWTLKEFSILLASFCPFISEMVWLGLRNNKDAKSVHLVYIEKPITQFTNKKLEKEMEIIRDLSAQILKLRQENNIKVRQPLNSVTLKNKIKIQKDLWNLLLDEVNIKNIYFDNTIASDIMIDTTITPQLEKEGIMRELIRAIQELRQTANFIPQNKIKIAFLNTDEEIKKLIIEIADVLKKETKAKHIIFQPINHYNQEGSLKIKNKTITIQIKKSY